MNKQDIKDRYLDLVHTIKESKDEHNWNVLLSVSKDQMDWFIDNRPELAEEYVECLSSIKWKNYLTRKEAESIISKMSPQAKWSREQWANAMTDYSLPLDEEGYYNSCSMWVAMNMIYSDDINTIAELLNVPVKQMSDADLITITHSFAVNKLKDKDGVFNIRRYFNLQ